MVNDGIMNRQSITLEEKENEGKIVHRLKYIWEEKRYLRYYKKNIK